MGDVRVHIHRPTTAWLRQEAECPVCHYVGILLGFYAAYYSAIWTCTTCGDQWGEGELMERPFLPKWRLRNVQRAQQDYQAWVDAGSPELPMEQWGADA